MRPVVSVGNAFCAFSKNLRARFLRPQVRVCRACLTAWRCKSSAQVWWDKGRARRKVGRREEPSERSADAKPRPDGQKPNMRQSWSDEQARICEVPSTKARAVDSAGAR